MSLINTIKKGLSASGGKTTIVFAEGWNKVIQEAALNLQKEGIIEPLLIFRNESEFLSNPNLSSINKIIIDKMDLKKYASKLFELRKEKGLTQEEANKLVTEPNYLCSLIVKMDEAQGAICGIEYTTKDTLRPALQIVKTSKSSDLVSSILILERNNETLFFSDVSLVINPTPNEIAYLTENAIDFLENKLNLTNNYYALLSYSTNGSGAGESVDKVKEGFKIFKERNKYPKANVFGEIQFDAAYVDAIRTKKAPSLTWKHGANVFIFPNIDSGNISYKMMQRCAGYEVTGPIIIGLDKPINDLSRGAGLYEVVSLSYITAIQAKK
ncbi:phosphotransacetylase [Malacoplasma muris]|uniref:phosphotransacetylase n=1 Tax=Malacoplasma muris TaxID=2119 RepID=UPI00398E733D